MNETRAVYVSSDEQEVARVEDYDGRCWHNLGVSTGREIEWFDLPTEVVERFMSAFAEWEAAEHALYEAVESAPRHGYSLSAELQASREAAK